ncbi:CPBP family glutamic-type intramembrane protease [Crateriforma conspicua]|uniref:CPBP family glutamic-type intramembrane protease n=1 Tax=Crateriforma conspicua TaxID=2527996 RepID=UPI0011885038|nr:CPBP family glutamic-type intramembrane protease [Crateriforma conspicua]QDV65144.1 CAAX amino terminal protease self- immunity [Crateriforma conspicua]
MPDVSVDLPKPFTSNRENAAGGMASHVLPYVAFLLLVQMRGTGLEPGSPWGSLLEASVPLLIIAYFGYRGFYPELRSTELRFQWIPVDLCFGIATGMGWMLPYALGQLPTPETGSLSGESTLMDWAARGTAMVIAVPLLEEIFTRSFSMRFIDTYDSETSNSFRDHPIGVFSLRSFIGTMVLFTFAHATWEWWVAIPWIAVTNLWFYWRRSMWSLVFVHVAANLTLMVGVAVTKHWYFI